MKTVIAIVIGAMLIVVAESASASVTYYTASRFMESEESLLTLDLDGDSLDDLQIDVRAIFNPASDPFYVATTFGSSAIAGSGGVTKSFSIGDWVLLSSLDFIETPGGLRTGGVYTDPLGNVVAEGWGGCTYDDLGNVTCPPGGPTNQVDLFLVDLGESVAWIDIDSRSFNAIAARLDFSWGVLENPNDFFQISGVPEPSAPAMVVVGLCAGALRRQRKSK